MLLSCFIIILIGSTISVPLNRTQLIDNDHNEAMEEDAEFNGTSLHELSLHNHNTSNTNELTQCIKEIFELVDSDSDGFLIREELIYRIQKNIEQRFKKSKKDSEAILTFFDTDEDGLITWENLEPLIRRWLKKLHRGEKLLEFHREDHLLLEFFRITFNRSDINTDGKVDEEEWHMLMHPEYSTQGIVENIEDLIDVYDKDGDGVITRYEFVDGIPYYIINEDDPDFEEMEKAETKRRLVEFEEIDSNSDGEASFNEIYEYLDPLKFRCSLKEVNYLMMMFDANNDEKLSLEELLDNEWLLVRSNLLSSQDSFNDEISCW
uniref:45 kDa calcium-binding protein n=1 Tax=Caenorhabditis tropicalis TaxID=1561998 RepID=A0A1I7TUX8_9PELO